MPRKFTKRRPRKGRKVRRKNRKRSIPRTLSIMNPKNSVLVTFKDITNKSQTSDFIVYNRQVKLEGFQKVSKWCELFAQYRIIYIL